MIEVQCYCGKRYKIAKKCYINNCPYCDSIGIAFFAQPNEILVNQKTMTDKFNKDILTAMWFGVFDAWMMYNG